MTKLTEGGIVSSPLLLRACRAGAYGSRTVYPGGSVEQALFTYLCGVPDGAFFHDHPELFIDRYLVSMSPEWERFIGKLPYKKKTYTRQLMESMCKRSEKVLLPLPDGFALMPFDAEVFSCHPFGHGQNYPDYAGFSKTGSGFVIRYGNDVVSSASSFLTFENEIELDVSTLEPYRRRGLADQCVAALLNDCAERGILVHRDAQNAASAEWALSHGFRKEAEYTVTILQHSVV